MFSLKSISWLLVVVVVVMLAATTGAAFAHEIQHAAHHTAGMHSSGVCAWMCAAGQVLQSAADPLLASNNLISDASAPSIQAPIEHRVGTLPARAPPVLSV